MIERRPPGVIDLAAHQAMHPHEVVPAGGSRDNRFHPSRRRRLPGVLSVRFGVGERVVEIKDAIKTRALLSEARRLLE